MTDSVPEKLGKYKIIEEVGRGGFAAVYKAVDTTLDRTVALKVLASHLLWDPTFVRRFQREAKVAANLDHSNIVTIHEVGQIEGVYFIAMQFLEGRTLSQILKAVGPLPVSGAQAVIGQIASALDYAHARGLVHRDIKPSNVIVANDGRATLTDFGLVKAGEGTKLSTTGVVFGTPEYMSPEQAEGKVLDARSDIYSLGVVLYEMLAGRAPFVADTTPAVMYKHVHEPPPLEELPSDLPPGVMTVVERALAKKREERYQSAGEMAQALQEATEARRVTPTPTEPEVSVPPPVVEKPMVEEVVSPPVERAAVAKEKPRPSTAPPVPKAVPKKALGWRALLAGGLVLLCIVCIIIFAMAQALWNPTEEAEDWAAATAAAQTRDMATAQAQRNATATVEAWAAATATAHTRGTATAAALACPHDTAIAPAHWPIILCDTFDTNVNDWGTGDYSDEWGTGNRDVTNGKYRWEANALQAVVWRAMPDIAPMSDFYLTVEARRVSASEDGRYGLVFRYADGDYYVFQIVDDQYVGLSLRYEDKWTPLRYSETSAIRPGQVNRLTVTAQGTHFTFYVNDQKVGEADDSRLSSGRVGVAIALNAGAAAVFEFDNFEVRAP